MPARLVACLLLSAAIPVAAQTPAPVTPVPTPVAVAMLVGDGVGGKGPAMLEETLTANGYAVTRVDAADVRAGKLKGMKVLIVPGGLSRTQATALGRDGREVVKQFVADGGGYVGLCAGCYLASSQYEWSLHLLPVKVVDPANWERGIKPLTVELTPAGRTAFGRKDTEVRVQYHNGPVLEPAGGADGKLIPLAVYREEVTRKGAKEGLMRGTPAAVAGRYGKGWAIGISPHPEQTEGLRDMLPAALRWARELPPAN
ncbi:MAG TPA: BPL-N domain-containing protein [Urbifossiella sp.]|nr:BPL-N domain-containing protein [Urbifossiella sp.]